MDLLRARAAIAVPVRGKIYRMRPPTVEEALTIIDLSHDAASGDEAAFQDIRSVARKWLCRAVYLELFPPRWMFWRESVPPAHAVTILTNIAALGSAKGEKLKASPAPNGRDLDTEEEHLTAEEALEQFRKTPWHVHIAEVAYHLSLTPEAVLALPWPFFTLMASTCDALRARWELSYITAKGLPYIEKDSEREKAFAVLHKRTGYFTEKPKRVKEAEQRKAWETLRGMMKTTTP